MRVLCADWEQSLPPDERDLFLDAQRWPPLETMQDVAWFVLAQVKDFEYADAWRAGELGQAASGQPAMLAELPAGNEATKKRKRGPSEDKLASCKEALGELLDRHNSLTRATGLAGIDPKTMKKWIPNVLETLDPQKRSEWICNLRALSLENYLGKFKDV